MDEALVVLTNGGAETIALVPQLDTVDSVIRPDAPRWRSKPSHPLGTLDVDDIEACWMPVHHGGLRADLAPHSVLARDGTNFGLPRIARAAVPGGDDRHRLLRALDDVLT